MRVGGLWQIIWWSDSDVMAKFGKKKKALVSVISSYYEMLLLYCVYNGSQPATSDGKSRKVQKEKNILRILLHYSTCSKDVGNCVLEKMGDFF